MMASCGAPVPMKWMITSATARPTTTPATSCSARWRCAPCVAPIEMTVAMQAKTGCGSGSSEDAQVPGGQRGGGRLQDRQSTRAEAAPGGGDVHQQGHTCERGSSSVHRRHATLPKVPIFDAHFHVIDPRFPLVANQGFLPEPFTVSDYRERVGGARGRRGRRGLRLLPGLRPDLPRRRARAARVRASTAWPTSRRTSPTTRSSRSPPRACARSGSTSTAAATSTRSTLAPRFAELAGWHLEVYLDGRDLPELAPKLRTAPRLVIDHLGMTRAGLPALLDLVKEGAYVKASGFGRIDHDRAEGPPRHQRRQSRSAAVRFRPPGNTHDAAVRARRHRTGARGRRASRAL